MKIDYVIIGCDDNPYYFDFWDIVSKIWFEKFNIIPVLGLITNEESEIEKTQYGLIKKFKKIKGIDLGLQTQIVRLYLPKLLNGNCLISDIDMIPLSKKYFNADELTKNNIIIFSSDNPECLQNNMYPMCYILGNSDTYSRIFDLKLDWVGFCKLLVNRNEGWYTDQKYLFEKINLFRTNGGECVFMNRGWGKQANKRIDRINWVYDPIKVSEGYYIDSHLLRPYSKYKNEINNLISLIE